MSVQPLNKESVMVRVHKVGCECQQEPLRYEPDTAFQEAIRWAEAEALAALDDQPSLADLPWGF
jgi:hypothetical protein